MQSFGIGPIHLPKKMKRLLLALLTTCLTTTALYGQDLNFVRMEIASAISTRTIRMAFGHRIADKWSIAVETGVNTNSLIKEKDDETTTHWNTLSDSDDTGSRRKFRDDLTEVSIYTQYWPEKVFCGPVFCMGGALKDRSGPDIIAGAGYTFKIWKGIRADILYYAYLIESTKAAKFSPGGIRIGISYVF